jgi:hypothetical protein
MDEDGRPLDDLPPPFANRSACMKSKSIGSLRGDLEVLASRISRATRDSQVMVWVTDMAEVHADQDNGVHAASINASSIVGTYTMGMDPFGIVEDLREARRERLRCGVLD